MALSKTVPDCLRSHLAHYGHAALPPGWSRLRSNNSEHTTTANPVITADVLMETGKEDYMLKRACQLMVVTCLLRHVAWTASGPMVGDWKLNPQKSKLTDVMKVQSLGGNKYSFDFGRGEPEIARADGTDQPGHFGTMIVVRVNAPNRWTFVRKKDGKAVVTGVWTLSKDGITLSNHFTGARRNGDTTTLDYVYKRTGPGSGFVGTWVSSNEQVNSVVVLKDIVVGD
jgi:hypothetical protein